jgi:hypothetical protein
VSTNGNEILNKAIPLRPPVLARYLEYLDESGKLDAANAVSRKLMPAAGTDEEPALARHCSRWLHSGSPESAIDTWNGLIERGLILGERVEPASGKSLVNANFERDLTGIGFDWTVHTVEGMSLKRLSNGLGLSVTFSRTEPESYGILDQYAAIVPEREYRFGCRYETDGMSGAGVKWVIRNARTKEVLAAAPAASGATSGEQTLETRFRSPADCRLVDVELRYDREPGTVRPEGSIRFSRLQLELVR